MGTSLSKFAILSKLWRVLTSAEQRSAMVLAGMMLIGMSLETLGAGLVFPAVAILTRSYSLSNDPTLHMVLRMFGNPSKHALVIAGMLGLVAVYLVKVLFLASLAWRENCFLSDVQVQLSQRLLTIYMRQPYAFHLKRNSAQLIRNVTREVNIFASHAIRACMVLFTEGLVLLGLCSLLLFVEPLSALIAVSVLGIAAFGFNRLTSGRVRRWGRARQIHDGLRLQHLQQGLGGVKDVKFLGREADFLEQYRLHNAQSARVERNLNTLQQLPRLWLELLAISGIAMLVLSMLAQGHALDALLPTLGLFAAATFRIMPSASRLFNAAQSLRYSLPVIDTLHAELELAPPEPISTRAPIAPFLASLELKNVTYTYPGADTAALKDASIVIRCGESVGFIGGSGAGKSTLVDILLGLLAPDGGEVLVDGDDIRSKLRSWQDQIGYVPQSIFLTDDTLIRNVAFGLPVAQIEVDAVWRAVRAAQLEEFVSSLPQGLDTVVGERGIRLSGGQRQRIGIARALYHDPAMLVLDEATSSLDSATEREVMQAVRALWGIKTIIIVAHRFSTVRHCDRFYRLAQGGIVQEGTPAAAGQRSEYMRMT